MINLQLGHVSAMAACWLLLPRVVLASPTYKSIPSKLTVFKNFDGTRRMRHWTKKVRMEDMNDKDEKVADSYFVPVACQDQDIRDRHCGSNSCISFESVNFPGHYLRHDYWEAIIIDKCVHDDLRQCNAADPTFHADVSFCVTKSHFGHGYNQVSFQSVNKPEKYLYTNPHGRLVIGEITDETSQKAATFQVTYPGMGHSPVPKDTIVVFKTESGHRVRHSWFDLRIDHMSDDDEFIKDAQFKVRKCLDPKGAEVCGSTCRACGTGNSCFSFESVNFPGHYLRHQGFVMKNHQYEDTELFKSDASFCIWDTFWGSNGRRAISSVNFPDKFWQYRNDNVMQIEKWEWQGYRQPFDSFCFYMETQLDSCDIVSIKTGEDLFNTRSRRLAHRAALDVVNSGRVKAEFYDDGDFSASAQNSLWYRRPCLLKNNPCHGSWRPGTCVSFEAVNWPGHYMWWDGYMKITIPYHEKLYEKVSFCEYPRSRYDAYVSRYDTNQVSNLRDGKDYYFWTRVGRDFIATGAYLPQYGTVYSYWFLDHFSCSHITPAVVHETWTLDYGYRRNLRGGFDEQFGMSANATTPVPLEDVQ